MRDKVILRPHHSDDQVEKGGIELPEVAIRKQSEGTVLALGPECSRCSIGETVLIPFRSAGQMIDFDGEKIYVIRECDLLGGVL